MEGENMKRGYIICILLSLGVICLSAQEHSKYTLIMGKDGKTYIIPSIKQYEIKFPEFNYKTYTPASTAEIENKLKDFPTQSDITFSPDERPGNMNILSGAYKPFFNDFTPMLRRIAPMMLDFDETTFTPLNERLTIVTNGWKSTWPGAGGITSFSPSLVWNKDRWTLSGGVFAANYFTPFNPSPEYTIGANAHVSFQASDRIKFNAWGQYANYNSSESQNPHMVLNPYYYQTNVGGSMEFKVSDKFGVGGGIQYNFNPINRKMERQIFIFPIFYK